MNQPTSTKKYILIFLILVLLGGVGYLYFARPDLVPFLPSTGTSTPGTGFNPFNRPGANNPGGQTPTTTPSTDNPYATTTDTVVIPRIRQISTTPHAGAYATSTATTTYIRFVDKGNGHIYEANSNNLALRKLTNTTIPRIIESVWNTDGTGLSLRYQNDETGQVNTFYASITGIHLAGQKASTTPTPRPTQPRAQTTASSTATTTPTTGTSTPSQNTVAVATSTTEIPGTLKGQYLSVGLEGMVRSPKGDSLFTFTKTSTGGLTGSTYQLSNLLKKDVYASPFTSWIIEWPELNTLTFTTKATSISSGFAYTLDLKNGTFQKILGGLRGLSTKMNASSTKVLYNQISNSGQDITMGVLNLKDSVTQELVFKTLAEKCIWSKIRANELICAVPLTLPENSQLPDDWYLGKIAFNDQIWHFDTETGEVHLLANLISETGKLIDVTDLVLDQREHFLLFTNKYDGTLWSLDLTE